jgi:hypothetical protein
MTNENLVQHVQQMLDFATYADGQATIPAFLLEQLADIAGVGLKERCYTEEGGL